MSFCTDSWMLVSISENSLDAEKHWGGVLGLVGRLGIGCKILMFIIKDVILKFVDLVKYCPD